MQQTFCKFKVDPDKSGWFKCELCGYPTQYGHAQRLCDGPTNKEQGPSLLQRIVNFTAAATKHSIAGNPVVDELILKQRLEICKSCPLFKPNANEVGGVCTHESCGCNIQDNLNYLNKIAWADQECPIGKWGKTGV